jgi:cell division protein FtsL
MRPIEVRFEKNIKNLTLVRETDNRRQVEYIAVALLGALFVMGVLFYGWQRAQYLQNGYEIGKAEAKQERLVQRGNELRLARERLRNPSRIESIAKQMGMVRAVAGQQVTVNLNATEDPLQPLSATK